MAAEPEVVVEADADQLAANTAARARVTLAAAVQARGVAHLVITGGSILEAVLAAMAEPTDLDWSRVHVWWGDERYVAADSDDRNERPARAKLLDHVPVAADHVHPMPPSDAGFDSVEDAAAAYAADLTALATDGDVPHFDVVLLGIGPDGHCASLFPGHPGPRVSDRAVIAVHDSPKPPPTRISLTFPALDAAEEIWVVASGDGKAEAVARALGGADRVEVPSAGPRGRRRTLWLVDAAAASQLPN
ncbi:MAG TPA: 6-phosphogluconolactonase [Jatrophihabitans sp.]|jgi:6-phosphogluconolactonase|uniref:6-phosphogluconolactonase n=1 Tax=Jatrophihabitans sp. TaxID=1932789 RepID=UPI002E00F052|nr:6-phosphogluconolactonase [Jatrophihabitans sp.]